MGTAYDMLHKHTATGTRWVGGYNGILVGKEMLKNTGIYNLWWEKVGKC